MSERFAIDTNAAIAYLRGDQTPPPQLAGNADAVLPLPVVGELFAGAFSSSRKDRNASAVEKLLNDWSALSPDVETARVYGQLRGDTRFPASTSRRNDLWIAALCIQHNLPLLTNDRGLDAIPGLRTIHW
jgi:tRNA(fMet)-specific endonuclease VapC